MSAAERVCAVCGADLDAAEGAGPCQTASGRHFVTDAPADVDLGPLVAALTDPALRTPEHDELLAADEDERRRREGTS